MRGLARLLYPATLIAAETLQATAAARDSGISGALRSIVLEQDAILRAALTARSAPRHHQDIAAQDVKVMKRISNRSVAVEAVLTRNGTIVGPFMSELTGHTRLTPYRGGWCGNEMYPEVMTGALRAKAAGMIRRLGDRLGAEGYRGFFEVDVLVDTDADEVYLGELNPRISGASAITSRGARLDV
jgi:biotin carboxylase